MKYFIAFCIPLLVLPTSSAQSAKDLVDAMKLRRDNTKVIEYEVETTARYLKVWEATGRLVDSKKSYVQRQKIGIDYRTGEFYWDTLSDVDPQTGNVEKYHATKVFAKGLLKSTKWPVTGETNVGREHGRESDFAIISGPLSSHAIEFSSYPLLINGGICPLSASRTFYPGQFHEPAPLDAQDLLRLSQLQPDVKMKFFDCVPAGSNKASIRLSIGIDRVNNIRRMQKALNGSPIYELAIDYGDSANSKNDVTGWTYSSYSAKTLSFESISRVLSVKHVEKLPVADMRIEPSPGMVVNKIGYTADSSSPEVPLSQTKVKIDRDGSEIPIVGRETKSTGFAQWGRISLIILILLIGSWFTIKYARKQK